jgi:hypothetical protein
MDLTKVAVSKFPRQGETPSDCLMTAFTGWSGNFEALAYGPGEEFGWRRYSFSRLTCHSQSDWLNRPTVHGSPGGIGYKPVDSTEFDPDSAHLSMLGAFPLLVDKPERFKSNHAPDLPESALFRSTTTSVDSAGWTEVVIQEGSVVPSYFIKWPQGRGKRQLQHCAGGHPFRGGPARKKGGISSDNSTCGCPGRSDMYDNSISCLSFNEVTK